MSVFTPAEITYLEAQTLGRLATVGPDGQPHIVPLAFRYNLDADTIDTGSFDVTTTKRYRDILGNPRVAFVVDELASVDPWGRGARRDRRAHDRRRGARSPSLRRGDASHPTAADHFLGDRR